MNLNQTQRRLGAVIALSLWSGCSTARAAFVLVDNFNEYTASTDITTDMRSGWSGTTAVGTMKAMGSVTDARSNDASTGANYNLYEQVGSGAQTEFASGSFCID